MLTNENTNTNIKQISTNIGFQKFPMTLIFTNINTNKNTNTKTNISSNTTTNISKYWPGLAFAKFSMAQLLTNVQHITHQSTPSEDLPIKRIDFLKYFPLYWTLPFINWRLPIIDWAYLSFIELTYHLFKEIDKSHVIRAFHCPYGKLGDFFSNGEFLLPF